jgi:uncharacterized lipoprotein YmbA
VKSRWTPACLLLLLCACASKAPDHFYILSVLPQGSDTRPAPAAQATLTVTLPASADRAEILLNSAGERVIVLEHERWAAPLTDLATQTLARDIERRRNDLLVLVHDMGRSKGADLRIAVDVVQMTLHRGGQARIDTQWQIVDLRSGKVLSGGGEFSAPLADGDYAAIAQSLSECLGLLADRLVQEMR